MLHTLHIAKVAMTNDWTTGVFAVFAVLSPQWLTGLQDISTEAALLLPIFGVIWLAVQIITKIFKNQKGETWGSS